MLVFRDWALMFVRSLKLPVRLGASGMRGCIRGCVLRRLWQARVRLWLLAVPTRSARIAPYLRAGCSCRYHRVARLLAGARPHLFTIGALGEPLRRSRARIPLSQLKHIKPRLRKRAATCQTVQSPKQKDKPLTQLPDTSVSIRCYRRAATGSVAAVRQERTVPDSLSAICTMFSKPDPFKEEYF
ncbi:hypothetical protein NDU88_004812 [Pleurodeles waltl]|uniref:Uncharacterized protein n=1 Tax=Pleurodeles waltl TaxID=8319 RepID=A0AAV7RIE8_PLEWA|nr:hypothetical protein NDU88_004812 [Pleurodeles waltl]